MLPNLFWLFYRMNGRAIVAVAIAVVVGGGKVYDHGQFSSFCPFVVT